MKVKDIIHAYELLSAGEDRVCPDCYHILVQLDIGDNSKLICPNDMCLNNTTYKGGKE
jgi:hypothetical protein